MKPEPANSPRTLSKREAAVVGWLEAERLQTITSVDAREALGWTDRVVNQVLSSLARKGWVRRTTRGSYETVLAETGGWSLPNPWAALANWKQRYYVSFQSAAYELQLTPDRPSTVQTCVPIGSKRPRAWSDVPITLIFTPTFDDEGVIEKELHRFLIRIASPEKVLLDGAANPNRIGGVFGLARVLDRAGSRIEWGEVVTLATNHPKGRPALRRLAALTELLGQDVPPELGEAASAQAGDPLVYLADRRTHGAKGIRQAQWQIVMNVDPAAIQDEVRR